MPSELTVEELAERAVVLYENRRYDSPWMLNALRAVKRSNFVDMDLQDYLEIQDRLDSLRGITRRTEIVHEVDGPYNHKVRRMAIDLMLLVIQCMVAPDAQFRSVKVAALRQHVATEKEFLSWKASITTRCEDADDRRWGELISRAGR